MSSIRVDDASVGESELTIAQLAGTRNRIILVIEDDGGVGSRDNVEVTVGQNDSSATFERQAVLD